MNREKGSRRGRKVSIIEAINEVLENQFMSLIKLSLQEKNVFLKEVSKRLEQQKHCSDLHPPEILLSRLRGK